MLIFVEDAIPAMVIHFYSIAFLTGTKWKIF